MTTPLWIIAGALLALVGLAAWALRNYYLDQSHLDVLTEDDVAALTRPYVDGPMVIAADDAPAPDSIWDRLNADLEP